MSHRLAHMAKAAALMPFITFGFIGASLCAQSYDLTVRVNDTSAYPSSGGMLSIYLTNRIDSVAGFSIGLQLDRPDLIYFPDFAGADTVGTLISGWEYVNTGSIGGQGTDIKIIALADLIAPPVTPPLPPRSQESLLVRIPFLTFPVPDTLSDRIVHVFIITDPQHTGFSDPQGNLICYPGYVDTTCVLYEQGSVAIEGCVTMVPGDVQGDGTSDIADLSELIDYVRIGAGQLTAPYNGDVNFDCCVGWDDIDQIMSWPQPPPPDQRCVCLNPPRCCCRGLRGNVDNDMNDVTDVSDLTALVEYLFHGGGPYGCDEEMDVDGGGMTDIGDLSRLVEFLFFSGPSPAACP
ncbi:MAG: hypothetical protein AB1644_04350 [Candidatus Zixiibacteriota bacterium]